MKNINVLHNLLKDKDFTKSIRISFATKQAQEDYDEYEKNYEYTNLNPITIRGVVTFLTPEKVVYKQYGKAEQEFVEVLTDGKYQQYFEQCSKLTIEGKEYCVFKDKVGAGSGIQKRSNNIIRVVLQRR